MRYLIACMLLGLSAGYAQETADEAPAADVVISGDEGSGSQEVASTDSYLNFKRSCPCGSKPK
jgi:hypothetical protein